MKTFRNLKTFCLVISASGRCLLHRVAYKRIYFGVLPQRIEQISQRLDPISQQLDHNHQQIIRLDDSRLAHALRFLRLIASRDPLH
jgi:hypothetical protein